ncbi:MAG: hypothetical protein U0835_06810 [Isosphaeraceae bacterium]
MARCFKSSTLLLVGLLAMCSPAASGEPRAMASMPDWPFDGPLDAADLDAMRGNPPVDPVDNAFRRLENAGDDWRAEAAAVEELGKLGPRALDRVFWGSQEDENVRLRRACYQILYKSFPNDPWSRSALRRGLTDPDERIRYELTFYAGSLKIYESHRRLRQILERSTEKDGLLRMTAAKSLAELGEPDVVRVLYEGATADSYMLRHMANLGFKAASSKNLNDFLGYNYGEGAFVSGGVEAMTPFDGLAQAKHRAARYSALAAYLEWLQKERPELFKHLRTSF